MKVERREFIKNSTLLTSAFVIGFNLPTKGKAATVTQKSNILEPKLMGKELGLSPLIIFFSLIFWGYILGIVGMFLAVPITMTLKIAFDSNTSTHWLGILMSDLSRKRQKTIR